MRRVEEPAAYDDPGSARQDREPLGVWVTLLIASAVWMVVMSLAVACGFIFAFG
jgi:hypothetical protein